MALDVLGLLASLVVLALTGDQFVIGVARLSSSLQLRPTVVGALMGGFGTSVAELIVAALAAARGSAALATGSLVGSITANVGLALCIAALVSPVRVDSATVRREAPVSVAAVGIFAVLSAASPARLGAIVMAVCVVPAVLLLLRCARTSVPDRLAAEVSELVGVPPARRGLEVARSIVTLALMFGGAEVMVLSTVSLSDRLGLGQGFAGLTLVGIGTSAPLIASSVQAARRQEHDLVVGNVLGGNLFIALIGGAVVGFLAPSHGAAVGGMPLALMGGLVLAAFLALARGHTLFRLEAALLLGAYCVVLPLSGKL